MAPGMPPVRRLRRPTLHGTRAERDLRVRGRYGSTGVWGLEPGSQASRLRSPPWSAPMDLPGPSARVGRDPLSRKAKGVLTGAWGDERHRSARAQSRRSGGPGWAFGSLPAPAPSPMATPGSATRRGRAWLRGVPGVQETAVRLFPARGYAVLPPIAPSFHGFHCFGVESSSEQLQDSRDFEGATPRADRRWSALEAARRKPEGGGPSAFRG